MATYYELLGVEPDASVKEIRSAHRIRLQLAGGAFPRFARNPGNGQVDATAADLVPTQYDIGLDAAHPSVLRLPVAAASTQARSD